MMKKMIILLCSLSIIISLSACMHSEPSYTKPVAFYYTPQTQSQNKLSNVIIAELREAKGLEDNYELLLQQYLDGPQSDGCISPFLPGTTIEEFGFFMGRAQVVLSSHLSMLSGYDLTLACSCLARTVWEMTDVKAVQISATEGLLNGEETITIRKNSFVLEDTYEGVDETTPN